jgi:copper chaperone CopZ
MKYITFVVGFFLSTILTASAQLNPGKATISTPGVQCELCKTRIENYVRRQYGVTTVKVDIKKKTTLVTWIPDRTNIENVKAAIATVGYDADDVTKEETSYKKLPPSCKIPAAMKDSIRH